MTASSKKYVIITGDDFGLSRDTNESILRAHREGILTTASLMVTGNAFEEAVTIARGHPTLAVGLHLVLAQGRSALSPCRIPALVDDVGNFGDHPARAGLRYYFSAGLHRQLEAEVTAQIERFLTTGLTMDHVNGHLNIHLHPTILGILLHLSDRYPIQSLRIAREPFWVTALHDPRHLGYKISHAVIFRLLSFFARRRTRAWGILCNDRLHGLLRSGAITEAYLLRLFSRLKPGTTEIYFHPGADDSRKWRRSTPDPRHGEETEILISPAVKEAASRSGAILTSYSAIRRGAAG